MKRPAAVLLLLVAFASPALAQIPVFLPEFQVNTSDAGSQYSDDVEIGKNGDFIVTWSEFDPLGEIVGRRFDTQTTPLGDTFPVNAVSTGNQLESTIARDAEGRFVVVWTDNYTRIFGRRFDADGTPLGGNFQVSLSTPLTADYPFVASDPSGNFVVVWTSSVAGGSVVGRRFDSSGVPLSGEFTVNAEQPGLQTAMGLAMTAAGFVVAWGGDGAGGPGIFSRLFDPSGAAVGGDIQVNSVPLVNPVRAPDVAMSDSGDFVVVWDDETGNNGYAVMGRRFDSAGIPAGDVFPISDTSDSALEPRVVSDSAGNFLVTWTSVHEILGGEESSIYARFYDLGGLPVSDEFQVNEITTGQQFLPLPAIGEDGSFVVVFTSGSGYAYDIKGRKSGVRAAPQIVLDRNEAVALSPDGCCLGNGVLDPGETIVPRTAWVNDTAGDVALSGTAPLLTGPAGPVYTVNDGAASYGTIPAGQTATCIDGADCYSITVSEPAVRPVQHWDAQLQETLSIGVPKTWRLHVGESFPDLLPGEPFYPFIENLFHNGITGGCAGGGYCPTNPVTRAQMAVFLLKSKFGSAHIPPPCTGTVFTDVPCTGGAFDPWIEELAGLGITGGCGGTNYCPGNTVTRQQMAVFLL